jgi:hypothetical protein
MNLSKIDQELLSLDPDWVSQREMMRLAWQRSSIAAHPDAENPLSFSILGNLKKKIASSSKYSSLFSNRPRLPTPEVPEGIASRPPRYFSRGNIDLDPRKNPTPIPYLLFESSETAKARPVPGNSFLLRSLCKGKGVLKQNKQGFVYLDVDNHFINAMLPFLQLQGLVRPPYFNLFGTPEGAHIAVIPARESAFHYLTQFREIGQEFPFEIEGLYSLEPTLWPEVEQVWFFKVHSSNLETLRRRYFLTEKPGGHSFHIAVAIKPRPMQAKKAHPLPTMRINIAYLPS